MRALPLLASMFAATLAAQDSLQLTDGRFVIGPRMSKKGQDIVIHYQNGDVTVPKAIVKASTVLDAGPDKEWTAEEREKIAKGLVFFEGKWLAEARRTAILEERKQKRAQRIADAQAHREWRNCYKKETKNFAFEYTIDPEVMQRYADMLEVYFTTFTKEWGITKPPKIGKLKVCFYHNEQSFLEVSGASPGVIGYFRFVEPIELDFFYERLDEELTQDVLFHEANHFLTHLIDPKFFYPLWVNESLAEYYGASEWDPQTKKMIIGSLQEGRLAVIQDAIKQDEWQKLEELMALPQGAFNSTHYAWGWSFIHFLMSDPKTNSQFRKFYLGLARDGDVKRVPYMRDIRHVEPAEQVRVFKKYMNVKNLSDLEQGWHSYVKTLKQASAYGYRNAGELALSRGFPIKAQRLFKTALDMGDTNCMTNFGYGRSLYQKAKYPDAVAQFEAAIAKDPLQGRFWMYLADAKERMKATDEEVERLRKLALEIEPDDYDLRLRLIARGKEEVKGGD